MAVRAKKPTRPKRVDSVRASRDGHQFHEAWVARCALGLLLPRFDLHAIAVEGLSEEDEQGAPEAVVEIADATFYYGTGASVKTCTRMEVAQFKYSISRADTPLRVADLHKTLAKFAATEKEFVSKHGADVAARKITYSIYSNRPFATDMLDALRAAFTGQWQPAVTAELTAGNPGVLALGDLASDLTGEGYLSSHRSLRHMGTHRFVVLHDMLPHTTRPSPFIEHHRQSDFEQATVKTLQMCRAALTYAREMVLWRERRLNAEGKRHAPMYVPPHHEIRGVKPRLRQR